MKPVESEIGQVEFDFLMFRPLVEGEYLQIVREGEEIGSLDFKGGRTLHRSSYAEQVTEPSNEETHGFFGLLRAFYFEIKELLS